MKAIIAMIFAIILVQITLATKQISEKLDKLIEINTPEYVNVIPQEMIDDKN